MRFFQAPSRARRALSLLAVAGLLGLTGVMATVTSASAGPLAVSSVTATDLYGLPASDVWITEPVKLAVAANANVGAGTLEVVNAAAPNVPLVTCSNTQSCGPVLVSFSTPGQRTFIGELVAGGQVVSQISETVTWMDFGVNLLLTQTTVPVGHTVTLEAKTARPVQFSAWYIELFDLTTGALVCSTPVAAGCSGTVTENVATTHKFAAFVSNSASTPSQLTDIRSQTPDWFVTWSNDGWQISLTVIPTTFGTATATATANMDVGPTPFYIEIFDETTSQMAADCGAGTACSVSVTPTPAGDYLVAFVAQFGSTLPPAGIEASSNVTGT